MKSKCKFCEHKAKKGDFYYCELFPNVKRSGKSAFDEPFKEYCCSFDGNLFAYRNQTGPKKEKHKGTTISFRDSTGKLVKVRMHKKGALSQKRKLKSFKSPWNNFI